MNQFIFKSRWIAIAFAALMLFSTYMLVGDEDDGSVLGQMQGATEEQVDETAQQLAQIAAPEGEQVMMDENVEEEFVDDSELIDQATGTDPSSDSGDGGDDFGDSSDPENGPQFASDGVEVIEGGGEE